MIKQECIGIPDMILLLMIFCFKKIKIKAEIVLSPGGAYFKKWQFNWQQFFSTNKQVNRSIRIWGNWKSCDSLSDWTRTKLEQKQKEV